MSNYDEVTRIKKLKEREHRPLVIFQPYNGCHALLTALAVVIIASAISIVLFVIWPLVN